MATYNYWEPPLATGGEKVVYRGQCAETGDVIVVKFLRSPYGAADVVHFRREVERARAGQKAGIARIIDANVEWTPPFYVEEYFPDGTLAERMAGVFGRGRVFTASIALRWAREVLEQLAGLHQRNIIHRDVKPANIMMRGDGAVLGDLGIGRTLARPTVLQTRAFVGTRGYASPEQELGMRVDHRTDLYSVGVILHELLTGQRGAHDHVTYARRPDVRRLLRSLLALNPDARFRTAAQALAFVRSLEQPSAWIGPAQE